MVDSVNNSSVSPPSVQPDRSQQRAQAQVETAPQPQQQTSASVDVDVNVELSSEANNLQQVRAAAEQEPEVRDERIDRIRQQIADGELKVNAQNIALQLILE